MNLATREGEISARIRYENILRNETRPDDQNRTPGQKGEGEREANTTVNYSRVQSASPTSLFLSLVVYNKDTIVSFTVILSSHDPIASVKNVAPLSHSLTVASARARLLLVGAAFVSREIRERASRYLA